jgi:GNAT superfamily N-acetyltransferase
MGRYPNHNARLSMVAVEQSSHRGGIGRLLLSQSEAWCRANWATARFELNALSTRKELVAWYERCGYRRTGETTPFPVGRIPGVELPEGLCFIELDKE